MAGDPGLPGRTTARRGRHPRRTDRGQRNYDALLEAGLRLLRSGSLPDCGGVPVTVVVRVDADDLGKSSRSEPGGVAQSAHGDVVDLERFLRLASEADVTTVVLTASGGVLDYGRSHTSLDNLCRTTTAPSRKPAGR